MDRIKIQSLLTETELIGQRQFENVHHKIVNSLLFKVFVILSEAASHTFHSKACFENLRKI